MSQAATMLQQSIFQQTFLAPPRKEGRSHPQRLVSAQRRRWTIAGGFVVISLVLAAVYVLHASWRGPYGTPHAIGTSITATPAVPAAHTTSPSADIKSSTPQEAVVGQPPVRPVKQSDQFERHKYLHHVQALAPENDDVDGDHRVEAHVQTILHRSDDARGHVATGPGNGADRRHPLDRSAQAIAHPKDEAEPWSGFDVAFQRVISMLPDELHMRELLRPFEGTGEDRLRDIGLRARAFKTLFEAWEALHLVLHDGAAYLRHDVVQHLRAHQETGHWAQMTRDYESFRHFFQHLSMLLFPWTAPYFPDHLSLHVSFQGGGRGIVLTAGDKQAPYLLASIPSFRQLGCTLPIEIMYLGDADLSEDYRAELESLPGVISRDLSQMVVDEGWSLAGWAAKPFAILLSSFQEVLFIDADSLFFVDPTLLFDDPLYVESGALFFRDRLLMPESKKHWLQKILPKPTSKQVMQSRLWRGESGHMQESGVMAVDKWRHFVALLMVTRMNGPDRDGNEDEGIIGVYNMVYGDKETFWLGWELVGDRDYAFHPGDAGIMGVVEENDTAEESEVVSEEHDTEDNDDAASEETEEDDAQSDGAETPDEDADESVSETSEAAQDEEVEASEPDQDSRPTGEYTICAPQLLHFGSDGRPLWFNGWVLDNKFSKDENFGRFEAYMKEPREIQEPGAWEIEEDNMCCLTSDEVFPFTEGERDVLDMIIGMAKGIREHVPASG